MEISIIIPTFNRVSDLRLAVAAILAQDFQDYELIIIDNGPSTDNTAAYCDEISKSHPHIRAIRSSLKGVSYARSIGNMEALGNIIIMMDDDTILYDSQTLAKLQHIYSSYQYIDVLGFIELKEEHVLPEFSPSVRLEKSDLMLQMDWGQISKNYDITTGFENLIAVKEASLFACTSFRSCFMSYRKSVLKDLTNFDCNYSLFSKLSFREETDFLLRSKNKGHKIFLSNYSAILHKGAVRDQSMPDRNQDYRNFKWQFINHAYMATKDMLEKRQLFFFLKWAKYQLLSGSFKNPGLKILRLREMGALRFKYFFCFIFGIFLALVKPRKFLSYKEYKKSLLK